MTTQQGQPTTAAAKRAKAIANSVEANERRREREPHVIGIITLIVTAIRCNRRINVQPPLNQVALVDLSQPIGWPSVASRTRMLFQLRHFQVTVLRPAAALQVNVHDRHNVSTLVDEVQPAAAQAWSATQKTNVMRAGRLCGTQ